MPAWITLWTTDKLIDLWISFVSICDAKKLCRVSKDCLLSNIGLRKYSQILREDEWKSILPHKQQSLNAYYQWHQGVYKIVRPIRDTLCLTRARIWKQMSIYVPGIWVLTKQIIHKWIEFNQWLASSYPSNRRVLCQTCKVIVPIEEIHDENICMFCHDYQMQPWYKSLIVCQAYLDNPEYDEEGLIPELSALELDADASPQLMACEDH